MFLLRQFVTDCDLLHVIFKMSAFAYKISVIFHLWKKSSLLEERARNVLINSFWLNLAFYTYIEKETPNKNRTEVFIYFL